MALDLMPLCWQGYGPGGTAMACAVRVIVRRPEKPQNRLRKYRRIGTPGINRPKKSLDRHRLPA